MPKRSMEGFTAREGVEYSALWFNESGLQRALAFREKLTLAGFISLSASEPFAIKNLNRDRAGQIEAMRKYVRVHREAGVPITKIIVMAAFGCNFAGDISPAKVVETVADALAIAREAGVAVQDVTLADSMGWATPEARRGRGRRRSGPLRRFADRPSSARHARAGHRLRL